MIPLLCLLFALTPTPPAQPTGELSSTNASYDGNNLVLTGQVVLDHGLGVMHAQFARLEKQEAGKSFPFSSILLQDGVHLQLHDGAALQCHQAQFDFNALQGHLTTHEGASVIYQNPSFRLLSQTIDLDLVAQEGESEKKARYLVQKATAQDQVRIEYANAFVLQADRALFQEETITAYPKDAETRCHLSHEGDQIEAQQVALHLASSELTLHQASGHLTSLPLTSEGGEIQFSCQRLLWSEPRKRLTLQGNVELLEPSLGELKTGDRLQLDFRPLSGKRVLQKLRTFGPTTLRTQAEDVSQICALHMHGTFLFDREQLSAICDSPIVQGRVPPEQQLRYDAQDLTARADQATLEYSSSAPHLEPVSLLLKGEVKLSSPKCTQYALADRLNYSFATHTVILNAHPGKRVLYCNQEENLQMSAQEVHITKDPTSNKPMIKGVGNVQLQLSLEELSTLQALFAHDKP